MFPLSQPAPLVISPDALPELYVWLESGAKDRRHAAEAASVARTARLHTEASALLRCSAALLWYVAGLDHFFFGRRLLLLLDKLRGTEPGLAMFSAHLQQQVEHWGRSDAPGRVGGEAQARLAMHRAVSDRFHVALGQSPADVARRARLLALDTDARSGRYLEWLSDGSMSVHDPIGPTPGDDPDPEP